MVETLKSCSLTEEYGEELVPGDELLEHLLVDLLNLVGDLHGGGVSQPVQHLLVIKQVTWTTTKHTIRIIWKGQIRILLCTEKCLVFFKSQNLSNIGT